MTTTAPAPAAASGFQDLVREILTEHCLTHDVYIHEEAARALSELIAGAHNATLRPELDRIVHLMHDNRDLADRQKMVALHLAQVERSQLPVLRARDRYATHVTRLKAQLDKINALVHDHATKGVGVLAVDDVRAILDEPCALPEAVPPTPLSIMPVADGRLGQFHGPDGRPHAYPLAGYSVVMRSVPGSSEIEPVFQVDTRFLTRSQLAGMGHTLSCIV